ncbi:MAG: hypothetical protein K2X86_14935 [Cytophagaceae bacterium]|nr:hypothetical protein [Cytophagaceae bacterium]
MKMIKVVLIISLLLIYSCMSNKNITVPVSDGSLPIIIVKSEDFKNNYYKEVAIEGYYRQMNVNKHPDKQLTAEWLILN